MNSLREQILFNSGDKKRKTLMEGHDAEKKEMQVMQRVLSIVSNFISSVEELKFELNRPNIGSAFYGPGPISSEPTISPEEMVQIKKKARDLFEEKMKLVDSTIDSVFGAKKEEEKKEEEKEENDGEEW